MKRLLILSLIATNIVVVLIIAPVTAHAEQVKFKWIANTEPDLAYYRLYKKNKGDLSAVYTQIDPDKPIPAIIWIDPNVFIAATTCNIDITNPTHYEYVLTAEDTSGMESDYSNSVRLPPKKPTGFSCMP